MKLRWISIAALPAVLMWANPAPADESAGNPEMASRISCDSPSKHQLSWNAFTPTPSEERSVIVLKSTPYFESIRYRTRRDREREREHAHHESYSSGPTGFAQFHGGFFNPDGNPTTSALFGMRAGANLDDHIQLGMNLDWHHRSNQDAAIVTEVPVPGGGTATRERVLSKSSSDLVPMMAIVQLSPGGNLPLQPYFGIGGGYEVLFLNAQDYATGTEFDATYDGWGWQTWAGLSMPLSGKTRLMGEAYWNQCSVGRDVDDADTGLTLREVIPINGVGGRFGVSFAF